MHRLSYGGRVLAATIVAASLLAPMALAQTKTAKPSSVDLTITLLPDGTATANVHQTWVGAAARAMRQSLDVYFGAADGALTDAELTRIAEAAQTDMLNQPLPWISTDGNPWTVTGAKVVFEGAAGRVTSTADLSMRHELVLASGLPSTPAQVDLDAPWAATLHVETPEGRSVEGGAPASLPENQRTSLRLVEGSAAPVDALPGETPPVETPPEEVPPAVIDGTEGTPQAPGLAEDPNRMLTQIGLGIGALFVLGALGVGAWLYMGGRKKKRAAV